MVLAKRILLVSLVLLIVAAVAAGLILLLHNGSGSFTNKGVFV